MLVNYVVQSYGTPVEFVGYIRRMSAEEITTLQRLLARDLAAAAGPGWSAGEEEALRNRLKLLAVELEERQEHGEDAA